MDSQFLCGCFKCQSLDLVLDQSVLFFKYIGMRVFHPCALRNKRWVLANVRLETRANINRKSHTCPSQAVCAEWKKSFILCTTSWFLLYLSGTDRKISSVSCAINVYLQFSSVQFSRSVVSNSVTPWIAAHQASLSITNSRSSLRPTSIESVMPSSHLTLCHPLLLLPPIPPSIRVFSNESTLRMRWPKYWHHKKMCVL